MQTKIRLSIADGGLDGNIANVRSWEPWCLLDDQTSSFYLIKWRRIFRGDPDARLGHDRNLDGPETSPRSAHTFHHEDEICQDYKCAEQFSGAVSLAHVFGTNTRAALSVVFAPKCREQVKQRHPGGETFFFCKAFTVQRLAAMQLIFVGCAHPRVRISVRGFNGLLEGVQYVGQKRCPRSDGVLTFAHAQLNVAGEPHKIV